MNQSDGAGAEGPQAARSSNSVSTNNPSPSAIAPRRGKNQLSSQKPARIKASVISRRNRIFRASRHPAAILSRVQRLPSMLSASGRISSDRPMTSGG